MATVIALSKMEGRQPVWWGLVQQSKDGDKRWGRLGSTTLAISVDGSQGLVAITGPQADVDFVLTLPGIQRIGDKAKVEEVVVKEDIDKVNIELAKASVATVKNDSTIKMAYEQIGKAWDGPHHRFGVDFGMADPELDAKVEDVKEVDVEVITK